METDRIERWLCRCPQSSNCLEKGTNMCLMWWADVAGRAPKNNDQTIKQSSQSHTSLFEKILLIRILIH